VASHILFENGSLVHQAYLCDEGKDPRDEFAHILLETLGERLTIFTYITPAGVGYSFYISVDLRIFLAYT